MSDNHSSNNTANTQEIAPQGHLDELNTPAANSNHQTELELAQPKTAAHMQAKEESDWEEVPLPGTLTLDGTSQSTANAPAARPAHTVTTERETELLTLIHDLNECNDVLLSRISQLEGEVEKTQSALKTEIDKASFAQEKMAKQVSAEQTSAQQVSQNAQQQVGKLVSQLETNEQLLSRQQLINENLQTELTNSQERITQLERECALASQQYADEAKARVKTETTNRDLRSRLQRQQRYTLQFKAALEKSLTVSTRSASTSANNTASLAQPVSFNTPATVPAVTMPKAQQIMPWAAAAATSPFQGIDPHLESLIRNAGKPTNVAESKPSSLTAEPTEANAKVTTSGGTDPLPTGTADSEAEAKLWQDLERVINTATEAEAPDQPAVQPIAEAIDKKPVDSAPAISTELNDAGATASAPATALETSTTASESPRFNWQKATQAGFTETATVETNTAKTNTSEAKSEPSDEIASTSETATAEPQTEAETHTEAESTARVAAPTPQRIATPIPPLSQPAAQQTPFTEPSPWGKPLPETIPAAAEKTSEATMGKKAIAPLNLPKSDYLPAMDGGTASSAISPVVNPLRTQKKKVNSLAAVELPTFETAKAGSFKR
ncbi:MAG: hypothetical protein AAFP03_12170 [Cyanobacteria bacterium J06598_3]